MTYDCTNLAFLLQAMAEMKSGTFSFDGQQMVITAADADVTLTCTGGPLGLEIAVSGNGVCAALSEHTRTVLAGQSN